MEKPADVLSIGQEITAKIVDFNEEARKISLSMKAIAPAAGGKRKLPQRRRLLWRRLPPQRMHRSKIPVSGRSFPEELKE